MSFELMSVALVAAVVFAGLGYLRRVESDSALRIWFLAWGLLLARTIMAMAGRELGVVSSLGFRLAWMTITSGLVLCLLVAAMAFARMPRPPWLLPIGIALGGVRVVIGGFVDREAGIGLAIAMETAAYTAGGWMLHRARHAEPWPLTSSLLALGYLACGGVSAWMRVSLLAGRDMLLVHQVGGGLVLIFAALQACTVVSRIWGRGQAALALRERDLEMLRKVARAGTTHETCQATVESVLDLVTRDLGIDAAGVWLFDEDRTALERVAGQGLNELMDGEFERIPADHSLADNIMRHRDPVLADLRRGEAPDPHPHLAEHGVDAALFLQLCWHDEVLGFLYLMDRGGHGLADENRALYPALADELSLALHHVRTVEARIRGAEALRYERRTLKAVLDTAPIGMLIEGRDRKIELINPRGLEHLACDSSEEWQGRLLSDLAAQVTPRLSDPEAIRDQIRDMSRARGPIVDLEMVFDEPKRRILMLFVSAIYSDGGERLGRVWLTRDVTEERDLGEQLRHSQKLETLGTLSGGIAHDFNNQLAVILGNARHLKRQLDARVGAVDSDALESVADLERAADHCAGLTRSLLAFSRRSPVAIQTVETDQVIRDWLRLLRPLIPASIEIEVDVAPDLAELAADPVQIQQVLMNLGVNARDAMRGQGVLSIRVSMVEVGPDRARAWIDARPGTFLEISVSDTGIGLDPQQVERIFEPFYTTKDIGEGTGLGLAIVHGVVTAHDGWVEVDSRPGRGATFRVLLPVAGASRTERLDVAPVVEVDRGACILVADDEPSLRRLLRLELEERGHRVLEAMDGLEAVELFRERGDEVDAVLLDFSMPRLDGVRARDVLLEMDPEVPIVVTSGRPPPGFIDTLTDPRGFIAKPFSFSSLTGRLEELIRQSTRKRRPKGRAGAA